MTDELLQIDYGLTRRLWADPDEDQLDEWAVRLTVGEQPSHSDDPDDAVRTLIAHATFYAMDPGRNIDLGLAPYDVADAHSADTSEYFQSVFDDDGQLLPDAADQFAAPTNRALFFHDLTVTEARRRHGLASLLAADAILTLAPHGTAVFAHPGPTDLEPDSGELRHLQDKTRNTRFLAKLGFVPFRDQLWTLDLSIGEASTTLAELRATLTR